MGDRITVVGDINDIDRLANKLGNSMRRLNEPNLITIFIGIMFGIIVGSINVGFGMKLGLAGGPLVVAILLSRFGYKFKLVTYTSSSASLLMRELGITLFLASVGISSGAGFAETVFNYTGMWWVIWGFIITFVPLIIVGCIARGVYHINFLTIMGLFSGGYTDPGPCLCQRKLRQRRSRSSLLNRLSSHHVHASGCGPGSDTLLPVTAAQY